MRAASLMNIATGSKLRPSALLEQRRAHLTACNRITLTVCSASFSVSMSSEAEQQRPKVVILTGPTGVGKTALSLLLAKRLDGEIISADSVQVYKGLDIGSDKGIPHHLLDICDLTADYAAGQFHDDGRATIADILQRGKTPIVVGGTGFYLRLLVEGKPATNRATPETEQQVEDMLNKAWQAAAESAGLSEGVTELSPELKWRSGVALLGQLGDQEAMKRIGAEKNNYYRLKRALCILVSNPGKTMDQMAIETTNASSPAEYDFRTFFLFRPRSQLYEKVEHRLQEMVLSGILDESAALLHQGILPGTNMASSAVGYRQAMNWLLQAALDTQTHGAMKSSLPQLVESISHATHRLIRSQLSWFRDKPEYKWVNMSHMPTVETAADLILTSVAKEQHEGGVPDDEGRLSHEEKKKNMSRKISMQVLASRSDDVSVVLKHVEQVLVPRLIADPGVAPALEAERQARLEQEKQEQQQELQRQQKRQLKQEAKVKVKAAKLEEHRLKQVQADAACEQVSTDVTVV